jgi:hypothetical protein
MHLFGFEIKKHEEEIPESPVTPINDDGAITVDAPAHGVYVDLDATYRSELDLIHKYRQMAIQPEMENAINDIVDEAIVHDEDDGDIVKIVLDKLKQPDNIKKLISDEFDTILRLLDFNNFGDEIFRKWYIDGRLFYNVVIDNDNPRDGIQTLIYIDSRKIKKVRQIIRDRNAQGQEIITGVEEYYIYNDKLLQTNPNSGNPAFQTSVANGMRLSNDSVVQVTSGIYDPIKATVLSYLHKAIRPMNQLRFVEDATVIYRVSRAPERRVFYIDVGNMGKAKAEQYLKNMMTNYRNKLTYDSSTGEVRDDRKHLAMLEDFWMPRRSDGKSTEITTLPAGENLGKMEDVLYFEKKLYRALGIPVSRIENPQGVFSLGRSNEITRDEIKYNKFICRMRSRFSILFDELLSRQLTLKGICSLEEWQEFKQDIFYNYKKDNNYSELKDAELLMNRVNILNALQPWLGIFFSKEWTWKNVLRMDEEEIEDMKEEMDGEMKDAVKENHPPLAGLQPNPIVPPDGQEPPQNQPQQQPNSNAGGDLNTKTQNFLSGQN